MRVSRAVAAGVAILAACAPQAEEPEFDRTGDPGMAAPAAPPPESSAPQSPTAPWAAERLTAAEVPGVYLEVWRDAENRGHCALLAPRSLGAGKGAVPRAAPFAGGWSVAYDQPGLRSAFGVAGTGAEVTDEGVYDEWPHSMEWSDGSRAGYGSEGGTGPNQLAYLRVTGEECLYNVWSRLGVEHLEHLLESLRFVEAE